MTLLGGLRAQLRDLQDPRTLHELHNIAGHRVHSLVMEGFDRARDPDGSPWAPTRRRNPILQDTLALRHGIRWKADSRGLHIGTSGPSNRYAAFHQRGTKGRSRAVNRRGQFRSDRSTARLKTSVGIRLVPGLPARPFLPEPGTIPRPYAQAIRNDFSRYFRQRYGGY